MDGDAMNEAGVALLEWIGMYRVAAKRAEDAERERDHWRQRCERLEASQEREWWHEALHNRG